MHLTWFLVSLYLQRFFLTGFSIKNQFYYCAACLTVYICSKYSCKWRLPPHALKRFHSGSLVAISEAYFFGFSMHRELWKAKQRLFNNNKCNWAHRWVTKQHAAAHKSMLYKSEMDCAEYASVFLCVGVGCNYLYMITLILLIGCH